MARTDNDTWGVAEGVSVTALGAAEGRSREAAAALSAAAG
jgi:hypothetical protein